MKTLSELILFYVFAISCCASSPLTADIEPASVETENTTLELVHVVLRHGPRTPVDTYPNDPYLNETFFPYGWGHLTNDAKKELFQIGKWLRKRYRKLLGPYYHNDLLHAQSTSSPRTLMSLSMVLASMFPPKKTPMEWNERYNWQPIPIFSEPLDTDNILRMTNTCPRYDQAFAEVLELPEVKAELAEQATLFEELSQMTGLNVTSAHDVNSIYITLLAEQAYGLELPEWTEHYFPEKMEFMAAQNYIYNAYTKEMRKIKGGPFLQQLFNNMRSKVNDTLKPEKRKIFVYCGHDWTITNILMALNVWDRKMPRFSALITFEMHHNLDTGEYYVEIYFKNDPHDEAEKLKVPGCDHPCTLDKLVELCADVLPDETFEMMCRSRVEPDGN